MLESWATEYGMTYEEFEARNWDDGKGKEMSDIDDGVAMPTTAPAPARRGRKPGTPNKPKVASQAEMLEAALAFVSPVESDMNDYSQYVSLVGNMAIMFNGQLAAGHPIVEELTLCPHLERLKQALKNCGKSLVITETDGGQLSLKGDKIRALVPCFDFGGVGVMGPDAPVVEGDFDILKQAFKVCGTLASEQGERVIEASLLLEPNSCTGTNGLAILQFWHGIANLPPGTVIPKAFASAVAACGKKITGIGAGWNAQGGFASSLTFWFEGGAWFKTQCYNDRWPNLAPILDVPCNHLPVPEGLFTAIEAVSHFIDEEKSSAVFFMGGCVQSHADANVGAQYEVSGLPGGKIFNGRLVKQVAPWVKTIDLVSFPDRAFFFGGEAPNPVRGAIMCMVN